MYSYFPVLKSITLKRVKAQSTGKIYDRGCFNVSTEKTVLVIRDVQKMAEFLFHLKKGHICSEPMVCHTQWVSHVQRLIQPPGDLT